MRVPASCQSLARQRSLPADLWPSSWQTPRRPYNAHSVRTRPYTKNNNCSALYLFRPLFTSPKVRKEKELQQRPPFATLPPSTTSRCFLQANDLPPFHLNQPQDQQRKQKDSASAMGRSGYDCSETAPGSAANDASSRARARRAGSSTPRAPMNPHPHRPFRLYQILNEIPPWKALPILMPRRGRRG